MGQLGHIQDVLGLPGTLGWDGQWVPGLPGTLGWDGQWNWSHLELDARDMSGMSPGFLGLLDGMDSGIGALCSGILGTTLGYPWEGLLDTQECVPTQSKSVRIFPYMPNYIL